MAQEFWMFFGQYCKISSKISKTREVINLQILVNEKNRRFLDGAYKRSVILRDTFVIKRSHIIRETFKHFYFSFTIL